MLKPKIDFRLFTSAFGYGTFERTQLKNQRGTEDTSVSGYTLIDVQSLLQHAKETETYVSVAWHPLRIIISPDVDAAKKEEIELMQSTQPLQEISDAFKAVASVDGLKKHAGSIAAIGGYLKLLRTTEANPLHIQPYPEQQRIVITFNLYAGVKYKTQIGMAVLQHIMVIHGLSATIGETEDKQRPYIDVCICIHDILRTQIYFDTEPQHLSIMSRVRRRQSYENDQYEDDEPDERRDHPRKRRQGRHQQSTTHEPGSLMPHSRSLSPASSSSSSSASSTVTHAHRKHVLDDADAEAAAETRERRRMKEDALERYIVHHASGP